MTKHSGYTDMGQNLQ